ncbi:acyl carrier protein [Streptomyces sp. NPDC090022]|uniref:acyl carrier protein n=1 Tax=Streptomyces sp. NPDC090022 TaxID=3365920 RepID=UPI00382AB9BB
MTHDETVEMIKDVLAEAVPGADVAAVSPEENFRDRLEMDSLDFLGFVEALGGRTGLPLPEQDYPALSTLDGCAAYVVSRMSEG